MQEKISIVIPAFNEEKSLNYIYDQLSNLLKVFELEIIFIDDGSSDQTFTIIKEIAKKDSRVKGISFSRNFGHQIAIMAGLHESNGEVIVMMDADGQHPVKLIPKLVSKYQEGFDIVNTRRKSTAGVGIFKKLSSRIYYKILNFLTDIRIEYSSSDFRLMSRKAVDAFVEMQEQNRFTRGMISWMGFDQSIIDYDAPKRFAGDSKYTLKKMIHFGVDGITSFSAKPLKISFYFGLIVLIFGIIYAIYAVVVYFMGYTSPGWTSIMLTVLILGGVQLLGIGILGEYLAKIFNEIKRRPHYFIKDRCGK